VQHLQQYPAAAAAITQCIAHHAQTAAPLRRRLRSKYKVKRRGGGAYSRVVDAGGWVLEMASLAIVVKISAGLGVEG
jgi:hypothetical protein